MNYGASDKRLKDGFSQLIDLLVILMPAGDQALTLIDVHLKTSFDKIGGRVREIMIFRVIF